MVNKVILIGNAGIEPEIRSLESGTKVARIRIATTEKYTINGERREHTEWHTVILWRSTADFAEKYIHKGTMLYIEGKIRSREKIDENGNKKNMFEIHADEVHIVRQPEAVKNSAPDAEEQAPSGGDGIPF